MNFDPATVRQGNQIKKEAAENPASFATEGGSSFSLPNNNLDKQNQTRMAGPGGAFAMKLMTDPALQQRVGMWNQQFAQSNQGMQFNQAKMMMMQGMQASQDQQKSQQQQQQKKPQPQQQQQQKPGVKQ